MDNPRAEKVAVVDEVRQRFDEADAAILTEYRGLKVKDLADLRRSLATAGGEYRVYKNTLVRFAARGAGLDGLEPLLEGPTGIAFVKGDAAAVAKSLRDYARTQPLLVIKGGVLGDKILSPAETTALAELPTRDVLLARLAGAFAAPLQQLAGLMQALPRNFAYGLAALRDQLESGAGDVGAPVPDAAVLATEADVAPADVAPADVDPPEVAPADVDPPEVASADVASADVVPADVDPAGVDPAGVAPADVDPPDVASPDVAPADVAPADVDPAGVAPGVAEVLDDATSPVLVAEAADPTPPE